MKKVMIKIVGTQAYDDEDKNQIEVISEGSLYRKNDVLYLLYEDLGDGSGNEKTRIRADEESVKVMKTLDDGTTTSLVFEQGKRYDTNYNTSVGGFPMEIFTNQLVNNLNENGDGKIEIDYDASLKGIGSGRSKLNIEILKNIDE